MKEFQGFDYPKLYIFKENNNVHIIPAKYSSEETSNVASYNYKIVTAVTEKVITGDTLSLIQYDNQAIGWVKLSESIRIYRFKPKNFYLLNDKFEPHKINEKLGLNFNYESIFKKKVLTVKSEIRYENERLFGVFVKETFCGFHSAEFFDPEIACNIQLNENALKDKQLYRLSNLDDIHETPKTINNPRIVAVYKKSKLARIKVNESDYYWIRTHGLRKYTFTLRPEKFNKNAYIKEINEIMIALDEERMRTRETLKIIIAAKEFEGTNSNTEDYLGVNQEEYAIEYGSKDAQITALLKKVKKLEREIELREIRRLQKSDYTSRLEKQNDEYKSRLKQLKSRRK